MTTRFDAILQQIKIHHKGWIENVRIFIKIIYKYPRPIFPTPEEDQHITMAGLLTRASFYSKPFPSLDSGFAYFISTYSCGYSSGFSPDSLLSP
jgi:hypothetical protein